MRGNPVPEQDHISRYCKPKTLTEDGEPSWASFMLKPDEGYLSVNWLEYFGDIGRAEQLAEIRRHISLSLASSGKLAILNVKKTLEYVSDSGMANLSILHEPTSRDPSHSGIHGYTYEDDLIAGLLTEVVQENNPAQ